MADSTSIFDILPASSAVGIGLSLVQGISGIVNGNKNKGEMERLLAQKKAYSTPEEIFKILQATENNASSGFDAATLNYMTGQTDRAFSSSLNSATRLGADPNDLSALFDQKVNQIMKIGSENHSENMKNFSAYLGAMGTVAENKAAEWKSQQDILKDQIQAKAAQINADKQNVGNAVNTGLGALTSAETANLFKSKNTPPAVNVGGSSARTSGYTKNQWDELSSILNYTGDKSWASNSLPYNDKR